MNEKKNIYILYIKKNIKNKKNFKKNFKSNFIFLNIIY